MSLLTENTNNSTAGQRLPPQKVLLLMLLLGAFLLTYFPVISGLVKAWTHSDEYSHGFFIVPIAGYIVWSKKSKLAAINISSSWSGFVVFLFSLLVYLIADFAEILTASSLSMVMVISGLVLFLFGWAMLKELMFPIFLLLFMIPVPSQIFSMLTIPLQLFVSKISVMAAFFIGVPVFREGNVIHLPDHTLEVVQACSGLRSLISLLVLSLIIGFFSLKSNLLRVVLFVSGVPVAIIVNIVRVFIMILAFHFFQYDLTAEPVHTYYGMAIFIIALALVVGLRRGLLIWDK